MATTKAAPAKKSAASKQEGSDREATAERRSSGESRSAEKSSGPGEIAKQAATQLLELTGLAAEGVTALERTDEGWRLEIEVLETRRIPDTTDMLAVYEVRVDGDGNLIGYGRKRRYVRGREDEEAL